MSRKIFRELMEPKEVLKLIANYVEFKPLGVEEVPLFNALGRVLAEDIIAPIDLPPFDRALVDGYAVRSSDLEGADEWNPVELKLKESGNLSEGEALEISTGSPIPGGTDSVIMVEYTRRKGTGRVEVIKSTTPGEGIVYAGSHVVKGEKVLERGIELTYREIGLLASLGIDRVRVYKRPKVAIISTGEELVRPGTALPYGKVYEVNSYLLSSLVLEYGGEPVFLGIVKDELAELKSTLNEATKFYDIVLTSGGTSAGTKDLVYRAIEEIGKVIVHGLKLKPGKPTAVGIVNGKLVLALPGYPLSCVMAFKLLVAPVISKLAGIAIKSPTRFKVRVAFGFEVAKGRYNLIPAVLVANGDDKLAYPILTDSGNVSALKLADGFILVPPDRSFVLKGEVIDFEPFSNNITLPDLVIIGSHCLGLEQIISLLRVEEPKLNIKLINVGSMGGLKAVRDGYCDLAGIHLLDDRSGKYNIPFLERYKLRGKAILVRGYLREQGLIIAKGNPKGIRGLKDILKKDVTFANRNRGSGTRILLEILLRELSSTLGIELSKLRKSIKGYEVEYRTHTAIALAIKYGKADVGLGIKAVAELYDLDFIPLREEEYDFLINKVSLGKASVRKFLTILRSEEFKEKLNSISGFKTLKDTGEVIYD